MATTSLNHHSFRPVLWFGVPWKAYAGLIDALPEHRLRHTYDRGTLELFKRVVYDVPWDAYTKILKAFGDRRFHHTYQEGALEFMMSPSVDHERIKRLLGRIVEMTALELGIWLQSIGSTTQRHFGTLQGLEPDESYHVHQPTTTRGKRKISKTVPDLAIEVELQPLALKRVKSYEELGIPELWRYRKGKVDFFVLSPTCQYELAEHSLAFPILKADQVTRYVMRMKEAVENTSVLEFLAWLRNRPVT